jgi:virulence-associated protein VagC
MLLETFISNNIYWWYKLFKNGRSQAVRLPKAFRMAGNEVKITKVIRNK